MCRLYRKPLSHFLFPEYVANLSQRVGLLPDGLNRSGVHSSHSLEDILTGHTMPHESRGRSSQMRGILSNHRDSLLSLSDIFQYRTAPPPPSSPCSNKYSRSCRMWKINDINHTSSSGHTHTRRQHCNLLRLFFFAD